jgi:hypothetical protein
LNASAAISAWSARVRRGFYAEQTERWLEHFSWEQFLFAKSETFFHYPQSEFAPVVRFSGLPDCDFDVSYRMNPGRLRVEASEMLSSPLGLGLLILAS